MVPDGCRLAFVAIWKALLLFALVALACAQTRVPNPNDPRCQSNRPPIQTPGCRKSFVYLSSRKRCAWTCGRGSFETRHECNAVCRTPEVCNWYHAFETCTRPFPVFFFQKLTGKCVQDIGGCRYTGNNFPTLDECQRTCKAGQP
uniref:Putative tick kunitz 88 n=1 Tax=Amblyomma parvum TaxID=251391 RepID=A0A023FYN0_AMBPA